jgi:general stress protein 26
MLQLFGMSESTSATASEDYEDLTACGLSPELEHQLVSSGRECVFMWTNIAGEAFGVVMAYLPKDGKIWMTAAARRKRIAAILRFPRASVCINSTGSKMGGGKTVTYKGTCTVHDDRAVKDWFYPEFADHLRPGDDHAARTFQRFLDSPHRVVIEFVPDYTLSFDAALMWERSPDAARSPQG